jgi:hypothetical protein
MRNVDNDTIDLDRSDVSSASFGRVAVLALFDSTAESRTFEQSAARALEDARRNIGNR